eukprot:2854425-Rhodomonas_salina.2
MGRGCALDTRCAHHDTRPSLLRLWERVVVAKRGTLCAHSVHTLPRLRVPGRSQQSKASNSGVGRGLIA